MKKLNIWKKFTFIMNSASFLNLWLRYRSFKLFIIQYFKFCCQIPTLSRLLECPVDWWRSQELRDNYLIFDVKNLRKLVQQRLVLCKFSSRHIWPRIHRIYSLRMCIVLENSEQILGNLWCYQSFCHGIPNVGGENLHI